MAKQNGRKLSVQYICCRYQLSIISHKIHLITLCSIHLLSIPVINYFTRHTCTWSRCVQYIWCRYQLSIISQDIPDQAFESVVLVSSNHLDGHTSRDAKLHFQCGISGIQRVEPVPRWWDGQCLQTSSSMSVFDVTFFQMYAISNSIIIVLVSLTKSLSRLISHSVAMSSVTSLLIIV